MEYFVAIVNVEYSPAAAKFPFSPPFFQMKLLKNWAWCFLERGPGVYFSHRAEKAACVLRSGSLSEPQQIVGLEAPDLCILE